MDDFILFQVSCEAIPAYNKWRSENQSILAQNSGTLRTGGRLWFKGRSSLEIGSEHFAEDLSFPLQLLQPHANNGVAYPYDFVDIDKVTTPLGIPWETSKDIPFSNVVPFISFSWNLVEKRVELPDSKKKKYLLAISEWKLRKMHTLDDVQKLYEKLLYTCLTLGARGYLPDRPMVSSL